MAAAAATALALVSSGGRLASAPLGFDSAGDGPRVKVLGTASFQGRGTAFIQDTSTQAESFYQVGDGVYGFRITAIDEDGVRLEKSGRRYVVARQQTPLPPMPSGAPGAGGPSGAAGGPGGFLKPSSDPGDLLAGAALLGASGGSTRPNFYFDEPGGGLGPGTRWDLFSGGGGGGRAGSGKAGGLARTAAEMLGSGRFAFPLRTFKRLSSGFGYRRHPISGASKLHKGLDLSASSGTRIMAADAGTVAFAGWRGGYGYCVIINHNNGFETLYGHCSKLVADAGDNVRRGDYIADVGSTGASTGPHLHFEVHRGTSPIDPKPFFAGIL